MLNKLDLDTLARKALTGSPAVRKAYLKGDLFEYANFYFPEYFVFKTPQFIKDYCRALES